MPNPREFWKGEAVPGKDSVLWPQSSCSPRWTSKTAAPRCSCSAGKELHTQMWLSTGPQPRGQLSAAGMRWLAPLGEKNSRPSFPGALGMGQWLLLPGDPRDPLLITLHTGQKQAGVKLWKCSFIPIAAIITTVHGNVTFPLSYSISNPNSIPAGLGGWGNTECPTLVPPWHQNSLEGATRGVNGGEREMCQWLTPRCPGAPRMGLGAALAAPGCPPLPRDRC